MFDSRLFISFNTSRSAAGNTSRPATSSSFSLLKRSTVFTVCALVCTFALTRVRGFQDAPVQLNGFVQQARLTANDGEGSDQLGRSVAVSGDTVVVGAQWEDSNATGVNGNQADNSASAAGAAYVFVRSGGVWSQQAYLKASNTGASDQFGISGFMAAMGGIILASRLSSVDTNAGGGSILLYSIAAAVIGGTSLFGGRGTVKSAVLGAIVIAMIDNGLGLLNVSAGTKFIVTGLVLLAAVTVDSLARRRSAATGRA